MLRAFSLSLLFFISAPLAHSTPGQSRAAQGSSRILEQALALGAPIQAVQRANALAKTSTYGRHDIFAVFDISQPAKNKRFFVFDLRAGRVTSFFVAHGRDNGNNFRATRFRGFQNNHSMTPLGPLRTASSVTDMDHYRNVQDRTTGKNYGGLTTLWLEGVASYNSYINNARDGLSRVVWIIHPAWYVTEGFRKSMPGGLGRSLGCIALDPKVSNQVMTQLQGGALVYVTVGNDAIEKYL